MDTKKELGQNNSVDFIKLICCVLIVGSHCLPIFKMDLLNYYYGQWLFRFCVPFFFIASGYFFTKMKIRTQQSYIKRIFLIYVISTAIYAPLFINSSIMKMTRMLVFGFHHLWYLSALTIGLILIFYADKLLKNRKYYLILMLWGGIFLDEYHKLFNNSALDKVVQVVSYVGGARHAIFFAVPMLLLGSLIASKEIILFRQRKLYLSICVFLFALGFVEATLLKNIIGIEVTADVTIFGWTPAIPLFLFGISTKSKISVEWLRKLRKIADVVYIIHVWIIEVCKRIIGVNLFSQLILVLIFSFSIAVVVVMTFDKNA